MAIIAGVDEVGRGPLAGPVVAAAVVLPEDHCIDGLMDSKKLSKKKREELYPIIMEYALATAIGKVNTLTIDRINIREATFLAMERALDKLPMTPEKALIDGEALKSQRIPNEGIIKGDNIVDSIKAASIIAKVTRDNIMADYGTIFPEYGFEKHSGYGTKLHFEALTQYKAIPLHRKTFSPVKKHMPTIKWLIENDKVSWMSEKFAGLYLKNNGYDVLEMNQSQNFQQSFNIVAQIENIPFVFVKVVVVPMDNEDPIRHVINDKIMKRMIDDAQSYMSQFVEHSDMYRLDAIHVKIQKNTAPFIKHFKGIK